MILGITGGTGCGKTTLLHLLGERGCLVLDCDEIYHDLLRTDEKLLAAISRRFPGTVSDGCLDRKKLGAVVFADPDALAELNRLTHASVYRAVVRALDQGPELAAIDAIALFESGLARLCDFTVAVTAPEEARVRRLMDRDGISRDYARSRIAAQHADDWFYERCDYILVNNGDFQDFSGKCLAFFQELGII